MAGCDYQNCSNCGCRTFYDADVSWEYSEAEQVATLCKSCVDSGLSLAAIKTGLVPGVWENYLKAGNGE